MSEQSISLVVCGQAGQGVQTVESLLMHIGKAYGLYVYATKEYMSRVRGGSNSTQVRVAGMPVRAPLQRADIVVLLDAAALPHIRWRLNPQTLMCADRAVVGQTPESLFDVPFGRLADELGDNVYGNVIAVGVLTALIGVPLSTALEQVRRYFAQKPAALIAANCAALERGYASGLAIGQAAGKQRLPVLTPDTAAVGQMLLNGAEAVALGALAGGCSFVCAYPMSPSTGVLTYLAGRAHDCGVVAEQVEDEISAVNMAIGAWYAGARALVTTSGGGFALMEEGVSLAAMMELPLVIHVAQRPGPATGLPTRTEQADLELVLYSGHGEFPRVIYAPGSVCEAFYCAARAFDTADRYQVPVFVLSDQYLMDTYYTHPVPELPDPVAAHTVETDRSYRRYAFTASGISPRGIPGWGTGLVNVDSDEHDEYGHITEDMATRVRMMDKRLQKQTSLAASALAPTVEGQVSGAIALVCWGSTRWIVAEARRCLGRNDVALVHFCQVFPLAAQTRELVAAARRVIVIEQNATGQFARLLRQHTGISTESVLKYDGLAFCVDELCVTLSALLAEA